MKLSKLLNDISGIKVKGSQDIDITGIANNSNYVKPGFLFCAVKGDDTDGHQYISAAIERGAVAIVCNAGYFISKTHTVVETQSPVDCLSQLASKFYDNPSSKINIVGITGTNGKTSTARIVHSIFEKAGIKTGLLGTIEYIVGERTIPASLTTPNVLNINEYLNQMVATGCKSAVMEVSSHGLQQGRTDGIEFSSAVFTNLGRDHLDYHSSTKEYIDVKSRLFKKLSFNSWAIVNTDDPYSENILRNTKAHIVGFGIKNSFPNHLKRSIAYIRARGIQQTYEGMRFSVYAPKFGFSTVMETKLFGIHNVYNILAAIGVCLCHGIKESYIKDSIQSFEGVSGRLEEVSLGQPFKVFIDYAHTPCALESILFTLRPMTKGKIILVFGCGGNRDTEKRAFMGRLASQMADYTIITTDNSRRENPVDIINEIKKGFVGTHYKIIEGRRHAIVEALNKANKDDIVIVAGKGHENYQIIGESTFPFSDKSVVEECLGVKYACSNC